MGHEKLESSILVIDDDFDVLHTARIILKQEYSHVEVESDPQQIKFLLNNNEYDLIMLDMNYKPGETSGLEGLEWLKTIRDIRPSQSVVMITAYGDIKLAVECMKLGATDFVVKPWENEKLLATVKSSISLAKANRKVENLEEKQDSLNLITNETDKIIYVSKAMKEVLTTVKKVAQTSANVLILGENGTGKELVAKSIHNQSDRRKKPFVKVDLGSLSPTLFESEMFGHVKGAFTDAKETRIGRFESADSGTLFLDEIGNLSLEVQAKLLTAIQSNTITKVGSSTSIKLDARIISATNANISKLIHENLFRQDLYYRLNTVEINIPPLRDRLDDLEILTNHFIEYFGQKYRKPDIKLHANVIPSFKDYSWPGNIRELQHTIERAVIMADQNVLKKHDFILKNTSSTKPESIRIEDVEKRTILEAITKHNGNISKVAQELGLGRTTVYRKMEKYGI